MARLAAWANALSFPHEKQKLIDAICDADALWVLQVVSAQ
jgi:hypothetical protein